MWPQELRVKNRRQQERTQQGNRANRCPGVPSVSKHQRGPGGKQGNARYYALTAIPIQSAPEVHLSKNYIIIKK